MLSRSSLILLLILLALSGCSTGPDFKRSNINDPKSKHFIADNPDIIQITLDDQRNINLKWSYYKQVARRRDGFLIRKKLLMESPFHVIDTLDAFVNTYIDSSKKYSVYTEYSIEAFINKGDTTHSNKNNSIVRLDFRNFLITSIIESDDSITVDWQYNNNQKENEYFDGFLIEKYDGIADSWISHDTLLSRTYYQSRTFTFKKSGLSPKQNIKISNFLLNFENQLEVLFSQKVQI